MTIREVKVLSDAMLIQKIRHAAKIYQQYVDKDVLLVFAESKAGPFYTYQFYAGKENFQHLAGVKYPKGADVFFDRCLDDEKILRRSELIPARHLKFMSSKIEVLPDALDLKKAKAYKFGEKDLITEKNKFSMAIGNKQNVMGFDKRTYFLPVPVTVMNRSIYEFCSAVSTIFLIMTKEVYADKYSNIFYEITKDLLHKASFGGEVLSLIDSNLISPSVNLRSDSVMHF